MADSGGGGGALAYFIRRLLMLPPILFAVSLLTFSIANRVPPEERAKAAMHKYVNEERVQEIIREQGWDRPLPQQYLRYVRNCFKGDLGYSITRNEPVADAIRQKFPATAELSLLAMLIALTSGLGLGIASAVGRNSWVDYTSMLLALIGISVPVFWLAMLVTDLIANTLHLPLLGRGNVREVITGFYLIDSLLAGDIRLFLDCFRRVLIPAMVLATVPMAIVTRISRASMLDVLGSDYIRTARAKGLPDAAVILRHALKNAALPILTIAGLQLGYLLGGAVLTETIFNWDGLGSYVTEAILSDDYAPVQGGVLVMATTFVLVNLAVDMLYSMLDPRIRLG